MPTCYPPDERLGWFLHRAERSFNVRLLCCDSGTLGESIDRIAEELGLSPDETIEIQRSPSLSEVREEAFGRFQKAIEAVGGMPPKSLDDPLDSERWFPPPDLAGKWKQVEKQLHCDLPLLCPGKGFYLAFGVGYALMLSLWVTLLYALGFEKDPTTFKDWITGGAFTLVMFVASFLVPALIAEWSSIRYKVPFESLAGLVDCIWQTAEPSIEDSLCRPVRSPIRAYLTDLVAEEYGIPREDVGPEFLLISEHLKEAWFNTV